MLLVVYMGLNGTMIIDEWLGKEFEGSGLYLIEVLSWHLSVGSEKNQQKVDEDSRCPVPSKVRTENLLARSLELYQYTNLLGEWKLL
jgi:hypothetical protein